MKPHTFCTLLTLARVSSVWWPMAHLGARPNWEILSPWSSGLGKWLNEFNVYLQYVSMLDTHMYLGVVGRYCWTSQAVLKNYRKVLQIIYTCY